MDRTAVLTRGSIPQQLIWLTLPLICGNILQQLYNTVDAFIIGRFLGSDAFGAVGVAGTVMNLFIFILSGCCTGIAVLFAQCYGSRDLAAFRREGFQALVFGLSVTVVLGLGGLTLLEPLLALIQTPENIEHLVTEYLTVIFLGLPVTFLYNLDKETAVFVEPRVVVANFREPYVNVNREASFTETSAMIQAGFRVCAANRKERASWGKYIFVPHFFTGLQVGGLKHMRSVNTVGDFALNYSGKFYLGYHLSRFATLKAAIEYETLNENKYDTYVVDFMGVEKQFTALWRYRYRFLNFKLAYMLNLSNIYQRYDLKRKFNFYVEAGALYTKCQSDGAEIYSGELEVGENPRPMSGKMSSGAPAALLGAVAQYRFNDQWSATVFGRYSSNHGFYSMAAFPYMGTSGYGGFVTFMGETVGMDLGVERYYDTFARRWVTSPIITPKVRFSEKFTLELPVGPLVKEMIDNAVFNRKERSGPMIMPEGLPSVGEIPFGTPEMPK